MLVPLSLRQKKKYFKACLNYRGLTVQTRINCSWLHYKRNVRKIATYHEVSATFVGGEGVSSALHSTAIVECHCFFYKWTEILFIWRVKPTKWVGGISAIVRTQKVPEVGLT